MSADLESNPTPKTPSDRRSWHPSKLRSLLLSVILMSTGGILLLVCLILYGTWRTGTRFFEALGSLWTTPQPPAEVSVPTLVVQQVRGASELTTAIFAMEAVVPAEQDRRVGNFTLATTKLLYVAYGEVRAGVDLSAVAPEDVRIASDRLRVTLPAPQILDSKLDVNRSSVYDYDRGFLSLGPDVAPQLQTLAARQTLAKVVETACSQGILDEANTRAEVAVTQLLSVAGDFEVEVQTTPPSMETCLASATQIEPSPN